MISNTDEQVALEAELDRLKAEGYTVHKEPSDALIPEFMKGFRPSALALSPSRKIAIDVITDSGIAKIRSGLSRRLFEGHRDWEFRVLYVRPSETGAAINPQSLDAIETSLGKIQKLRSESELQSALLLSWAAFEALGRALLPASFVRPQTPGRLVEVLANSGYVTPDEADLLRGLAGQRNRLIHGDLNVTVQSAEVASFSEILATLLGYLKEAA